MFEITGMSKKTFRTETVAVASNASELRRILREEADNYFGLQARRLRFAR